ncbi:MAG: VWA domain-containing protein [Mycobacterium sp.]
MTNENLTLIAALLDRSGSMQDCKRATETGFDELIAKQRTEPGEAVVTLSMFDDVYENVYANVPIAEVVPLELEPRNMTAMLDATGRFITEIGEQLAGLPEAERPGTVICLIMTDGFENASKEWSWAAIEALITQQREQYDWKFIFLGANIDAEQVGVRMGVPLGNSMTYDTDLVGPAMASTSRARASARACAPMAFTPGERAGSVGRPDAKRKRTK